VAAGNVELVMRIHEEWARGDFSHGAAFHPDVAFEMHDWPEGSSVRGLAAMREAWMATLSAWEDFRAVPYEYIDTGDHVVVLNHASGRGKGSGADVRAKAATVWTFEDGKIVSLGLYWDSAKALAAVGIER
jgi:ketosteroid isomerase-like protein